MPKIDKVLCDTCENDLTDSGQFTKYRIVVKSELVPTTSSIVKASLVKPPIKEALYFCDMDCLRKYFGGSLVNQEFGVIEKGANVVGIKIDRFG